MSYFAKIASFASLGLLLALVSCSKSNVMDAKTVELHRTRLSLAEEPDDIQTVADVRVALLGEEHDPHAGHDHDGDGLPDDAAEEYGEDGDDHEAHADGEHAEDDEDGEDHAADDHGAHSDEDGHSDESIEVSMVGHIGGLANPWAGVHPDYPFAKTQAVLFLADPQAIVENEAAGHVHAPGEECPYCVAHAADKADMLAIVQFVDQKGKVLPIDIREMFDVKEQDMVVVKGKAYVAAGNILVVDAQGLYIRN